ncbi:pentatricopeptide repeat-containing protein At1g10910, chloroplastic [Zea mays]|uniref:Pentatricopeptide repeat-containing protein chloroplastic n=2 Tax=Zea mays TaxID=4577 RepID=A0A1D6NMI6_MAIZE|nr:pentatricopeptide repeat-containing protein At1g10910, chloroplastic [Zea mays]XP_008675502.1 pentatricopeptide repeat-containing protein At1g10910, chloroplastic [Zea mays]XP_008675503.1 pentatricopeptide repeat-containing protein At1g10910, chloroplastic [Zea mays]XP_020406185.1 pentatricopeptide repeat-containing protein At1g10910, chloroplastic [Zea mays]XP_020406186.1 pentatricopeptide repeat-containing protein At1g10910, chloroplastic [Zea mays]XP_020406187.1 pentatricopeptide repeat-|eukprot:XP_008675501.1 pentatricopeptide repeat-containing protein At1g10910, chloroplastic [Zea mays]
MELSPLPMLAASRFLSLSPLLAPTCPQRTAPSVRVATQTLEAPEAPKPPRPSPRRSAVAEVKGALDPIAALNRFEEVLQTQDCNIILRHCGDIRRWDDLSKVFEWMQEREMTNAASYSSYFKYLGLSRDPARVLRVYGAIKDRTLRVHVSVCNSVLGCLVKNGRLDSSFKLYDEMIREGLSPDPFTYSTLLAGCMKLKQGYTKAMGLINEMKSRGLQMDIVIYGTLLAICASHNYCEEAEVYFQKMKDEGHSPNLFHYSSLLNAYSENSDYGKAELLMKDLRSSGLTPNKVMLTTLLKVYSKGGLFEKAKGLLTELEASGFAQDEMPYCILIDGLVKGGKIQEANILFNEMKEKGVKSDGYAFSIMISALHRGGHHQESKQLAKEFESENASYDLVMLNTSLRTYCSTNDMESVMRMLKKMDESNISPDNITFNTLIRYFCNAKVCHLAYKTVEDMHAKGHQLNEELCSHVMVQLGKAGFPSEAFSVYNMLRYSKRTVHKSLHEKVLGILVPAELLKAAYIVVKDNADLISPSSLEKFAKSFMVSGNINLINDVMKALNRSGWRISQDIFGRAIKRYIQKPDKKQLLLCLLDWMIGQGYSVDSSSRNLLLKNAQLFGEKQVIAEILSKQQIASRTIGLRHKK